MAGRNDCPPKVLEQIEDFYACRSCGKLYWEGPKSSSAFDHFASVLDGFGAVLTWGSRFLFFPFTLVRVMRRKRRERVTL